MKPFILALFIAAGAASAAPYTAVLADTNGVVRVPAMLTLTNVVIQGFAFEDLDDVDISARSVGDVPTWDGTNLVFLAPGGHDPLTLGAGDIGTLVGQVRAVTTNNVRAAVAGLYLPLDGSAPMTGTINGISAEFTDTISADIVTASNVTVIASGAVMKDGDEYWHPSNDGAGSGLDSDLLDGNSSAYYRDAGNMNAGSLSDSRLSDAARTITIRGDMWTGPQVSEKPGWAIKSFDLAGETKLLARGFQDFSGTQYTATADSEFRTPTDATAFRTTAAILVTLLADSTTSSICSYRIYVYKNATQIYDSGASQTVASTSAKHVVSIPASSLGTFTAGATYTVRVEASVKYDSSVAKGIYFVGTPTIQVIK